MQIYGKEKKFILPLDDLTTTQREFECLASIVAGVELLAVRGQSAAVMHLDPVAALRGPCTCHWHAGLDAEFLRGAWRDQDRGKEEKGEEGEEEDGVDVEPEVELRHGVVDFESR